MEYSDEEMIEANLDLKAFDLVEEDEDALEDIFPEEVEAELTKEQKTLPPFLQKKILEKKGKPAKIKDSKKTQKKNQIKKKKNLMQKKVYGKIFETKKKRRQKLSSSETWRQRLPRSKSCQKGTKQKDEASKDFKPHDMYDPETGKAYKAKSYEEHMKYKKWVILMKSLQNLATSQKRRKILICILS